MWRNTLRSLDIWFIRGFLEFSFKDSQAKINLNSDLWFHQCHIFEIFLYLLTPYLNCYKMNN